MVVYHQMIMKFKENVTPEQINEIISVSLAMKDTCVHEVTQKPYIRSVEAGKSLGYVPNKPGFTHALLYTFATEEDCQFFIFKDAKHHEARRFREQIEDAVVINWSPNGL